MNNPFVAYIGIDLADRKHDICLQDAASQTQEFSVIGAQPQDIADWVHSLQQRYGNAPIAVCLEQKRGPLIYALCQYENLVLFSINPRTVAQSDPVDAQLLIELLLKHRDKIQPWTSLEMELSKVPETDLCRVD